MTTNDDVIKSWSTFSSNDLAKFGNDGDNARQLLLDPTLFTLLGDVTDRDILDAGCGNGYMSRKLAVKGAKVTGIEPAITLFQHCINNEDLRPLNITYRQEDISKLTDTNRFDVVIAINVLMDIPDYTQAVTACTNALRPNGKLIISLLHPCFPGTEQQWRENGFVKITDYFTETSTPQKYGKLFHRPLQNYINAIAENDCSITKIIEPRLKIASSERNSSVPQFIFIQAVKNDSKLPVL